MDRPRLFPGSAVHLNRVAALRACRLALSIMAMAALLALLAYYGITLTRGTGRIATLWLPNAVLAAVLLRGRPGDAPLHVLACAAANLFVDRLIGDTWTTAAILSSANLIEVTLAVGAMRRLCGREPAMDRLGNLGWLFLVCLGTPVVSGTLACIAIATSRTFLPTLKTWVLADGLSLMIVTPIVMIAVDAWRARQTPRPNDLLRWGAFLLGTVIATCLIFGQSSFPFLFLACPIVIIAAFYMGTTGTAAAITVISLVASAATLLGSGPVMLVHGGLDAKVVVLQLFLATSFAMSLPVAAVLAARNALLREFEAGCDFTRSILDDVQDVIFKTDAHGRWVFLNPAWERITGYTVAESLGWPTTRLLHDEDRRIAAEIYPRLASGEIGERVLRQRFFNAAGECRQIEVTVRRNGDGGGRFTGTTGIIRDVSDRHQHERELADSEARFRRMAEAAPIGIFCTDADRQVTYVNRTWCEKVGLSAEQSLGMGWRSALVDQAPYEEDEDWTGFNTPSDVRRVVVRFRAPDGGEILIETASSAEFDEHGVIIGYIGAMTDITQQRRATAKLEESERRFQALANLAPAGIFRTDQSGGCTYVNAAWQRIAGVADLSWQGEGWGATLHPEDREHVLLAWTKAVEERRDYRAEFRWLRPDGSCSWVEALGRPEFAPDGGLLGFIGVTMDITERRATEHALAEREDQLSVLATNATDAVFRLELTGRCRYASPSARALLGIDPALLIGVQMLDRFHPDDHAGVLDSFASLADGTAEAHIIAYRSELLHQPGVYRWLEAHCGLVRDAAGAPAEIIASIRDVSKNKALEEELHHARKRAEHATATRTAFLANMSHEIRTPMNGVLGFTELLLAGELAGQQKRYVELIADSGRAMMRLLNDILDISKIDSGQMLVVREPVDLRHELHNCARLTEPIAREKGVHLTIEIDDAIPRRVLCDALRLRQVLLNLIGNAVKFTDEGRIAVTARLERCADGTMLALAVVDSGVGIAADRLEVIFQQFAQADSSIARKYGGTGLGLSISDELARLMGGTIEVASTPGSGSTFTVRLPLIEADAEPAAPEDVAIGRGQEPPAPRGHLPRVLIAEDHEINQALILALAQAAGLDPTIAADGAQAVELVRGAAAAGAPFELVLMDMQMPIVDGLEATRQIRSLGFTPAQLPIVALTANAYAEDVQACLAAGMQAHLSKPVRLRDLSLLTGRFLRGAAPVRDEAPAPTARPLAERYRQRRQETLEAVAAAVRGGALSGGTFDQLTTMLHKLAGTAGFFGDEALGDSAAALEHALRDAAPEARCAVLAAGLSELQRAA